MSTPTPQKPPPSTNLPLLNDSSAHQLIHYVSWGALIVCPIIVLLPPRKLDFGTLGLLGTTFLGGNQISKEYTGVSMTERFAARASSFSDASLPPKAQETQRRLREEKEGRERTRLGLQERVEISRKEGAEGVLTEVEKVKKEADERRLLEKIWMGSEGEDWKKKRDQREKEALEQGRGYGGLIVDQIWEVWNWGKDKNEEVKKIDEKVVAERKAKDAEEKKR